MSCCDVLRKFFVCLLSASYFPCRKGKCELSETLKWAEENIQSPLRRWEDVY